MSNPNSAFLDWFAAPSCSIATRYAPPAISVWTNEIAPPYSATSIDAISIDATVSYPLIPEWSPRTSGVFSFPDADQLFEFADRIVSSSPPPLSDYSVSPASGLSSPPYWSTAESSLSSANLLPPIVLNTGGGAMSATTSTSSPPMLSISAAVAAATAAPRTAATTSITPPAVTPGAPSDTDDAGDSEDESDIETPVDGGTDQQDIDDDGPVRVTRHTNGHSRSRGKKATTTGADKSIRQSGRRILSQPQPVAATLVIDESGGDDNDDARTTSPDSLAMPTTNTTTTNTTTTRRRQKRSTAARSDTNNKKARTGGSYDMLPVSDLELQVEKECGRKHWACKVSDDKQRIEHDIGCPIGKRVLQQQKQAQQQQQTTSTSLSSLSETATPAELYARLTTLIAEKARVTHAATIAAAAASSRPEPATTSSIASTLSVPQPMPQLLAESSMTEYNSIDYEKLISLCDQVATAIQQERSAINNIRSLRSAQLQAVNQIKTASSAANPGFIHITDPFYTASQRYTKATEQLYDAQKQYIQQTLISDSKMYQFINAHTTHTRLIADLHRPEHEEANTL